MSGTRLDTTTPMGMLLVTMLSGIAEFERGLMLERQRSGIENARRLGKYKGRPISYSDTSPKLMHGLDLMEKRNENGMTVKQIAHITGISRALLYRRYKERQEARE
jgi:DNA invertase Pin-like site-specific DNA recombinase